MKLSRHMPACLLFMVAGSATAADSVTLYGNLDTGLEYVSHVGANSSSLFRMPGVTQSLPSFWGITGNEDIGGGYRARFTLESGFDVRSGGLEQGGRLFGRQAFVALAGPLGQISFGRQYTETYYALAQTDVIGPSIYSVGSLDAYLASSRSDNTVAYTLNAGPWTLGGTYSFGRDSTGTGNTPGQGTCVGQNPASSVQCTQWSAMVMYGGSHVGADVVYDVQHGGPGAAANFFDGRAPVPFVNGTGTDGHLLISGYLAFDKLKVTAGWINRNVDFATRAESSIRTNFWYLGASYYITPALIFVTQVYRIVNPDHDTRAVLVTSRAMYLLSKASAIYAQIGFLENSAHAAYTVSAGGGGTTPAAGANQTGVLIGIRHFF